MKDNLFSIVTEIEDGEIELLNARRLLSVFLEFSDERPFSLKDEPYNDERAIKSVIFTNRFEDYIALVDTATNIIRNAEEHMQGLVDSICNGAKSKSDSCSQLQKN